MAGEDNPTTTLPETCTYKAIICTLGISVCCYVSFQINVYCYYVKYTCTAIMVVQLMLDALVSEAAGIVYNGPIVIIASQMGGRYKVKESWVVGK